MADHRGAWQIVVIDSEGQAVVTRVDGDVLDAATKQPVRTLIIRDRSHNGTRTERVCGLLSVHLNGARALGALLCETEPNQVDLSALFGVVERDIRLTAIYQERARVPL